MVPTSLRTFSSRTPPYQHFHLHPPLLLLPRPQQARLLSPHHPPPLQLSPSRARPIEPLGHHGGFLGLFDEEAFVLGLCTDCLEGSGAERASGKMWEGVEET